MDDPTIIESLESAEFLDLINCDIEEGDNVDSIAKEKKFLDFKKAVQDARLKSAPCPSHFIITINMNSPESGVTEKRWRFVSIVMRSFFSSIIFCQELPRYFNDKVVAECGTSGYDYVKNGDESAVLWQKEDFHGETDGLETSDKWIRELRDSLGSDTSELLSRIAMVKLTSKVSGESVLAVSWHGPYKVKRQEKMGAFKSLTIFLDIKIIKEKKIPSYIIGGDFNLNPLAPDIELAEDVTVPVYELSDRQKAQQQKSGKYIPFKDTFVLYPGIKKLIVSHVRPFLIEDEGTAASDLSKDDQAKVKGEMAEATDTPARPTDMLDHDPIIGVIQFTSTTAARRNLSDDFERLATADAEQD